jgi:hypothetical protein
LSALLKTLQWALRWVLRWAPLPALVDDDAGLV